MVVPGESSERRGKGTAVTNFFNLKIKITVRNFVNIFLFFYWEFGGTGRV